MFHLLSIMLCTQTTIPAPTPLTKEDILGLNNSKFLKWFKSYKISSYNPNDNDTAYAYLMLLNDIFKQKIIGLRRSIYTDSHGYINKRYIKKILRPKVKILFAILKSMNKIVQASEIENAKEIMERAVDEFEWVLNELKMLHKRLGLNINTVLK